MAVGYPMTYRRVLSRSGLDGGDYGKVPERLFHQAPVTVPSVSDEWKASQYFVNERQAQADAKAWNDRMAFLAGDLRRLEKDTADEDAVCKRIAQRTGVDAGSVAAVLRAYLEL